MVDFDRGQIPISGTMIRENPGKYKDYMDEYVYREYSEKLNKNLDRK